MKYFRVHCLLACMLLMTAACAGQAVLSRPTSFPTLTPSSTPWEQITAVSESVGREDVEQAAITLQPPTAIPPTNTNTPTPLSNTPTSTITPTPTPTEPLTTPMPSPTTLSETQRERLLLLGKRPSFSGATSKPLMRERILRSQRLILDTLFLLNEVPESGRINCQLFVMTYENIQLNSPIYTVDEELSLANFHYNQATNSAIVELHPLYELCLEQETESGNYRALPLDDEEAPFAAIYENREQLLIQINDALLWLNGDDSKTRGLYGRTRGAIEQHIELIDEGTTAQCEEITNSYEQIGNSPRLIVANGVRLEAYRHYLDALNFVEQGSAALNQECFNYLERAKESSTGDVDGQPLPEDVLEIATRTARRALTSAISAVDTLPLPTPFPTITPSPTPTLTPTPTPTLTPTPTPTPILLASEVVSVYRGLPDTNTYVVRVKVYYLPSLNPVSVQIGEFDMDAAGFINVVHTCHKSYWDQVILTLPDGRQIKGERFTADGSPYCD